MGKAKNNEVKKYTLTDREFNYAKTMAVCLAYNIARDKLISGYLYFIANYRLGYDESVDLQFEIDLDNDSHELLIKPIESE